MGLLGPSKKERELAADLRRTANESSLRAKGYRAQAARAIDDEKNGVYKDPEATNAIVRHHRANQRIAESNARELRTAAEKLDKPWWKR